MKRPLKSRFWLYRPGAWLPGFRFIQRGGDEFEWHTIVIGSRLTGAVVIATRPCDYTGACEELLDFYKEEGIPLPKWPVDGYGHTHIGPCSCETCLDDPHWNC